MPNPPTQPAAPDASPSSLLLTRLIEVEENLGQQSRASRELQPQDEGAASPSRR